MELLRGNFAKTPAIREAAMRANSTAQHQLATKANRAAVGFAKCPHPPNAPAQESHCARQVLKHDFFIESPAHNAFEYGFNWIRLFSRKLRGKTPLSAAGFQGTFGVP